VIKGLRGANFFNMAFDLVGAIVLALYALILGPLGVLRGPIAFERSIWYLWVLLPQGLMARSVRAAIDWRLGNFDSAIAQLEGLVGSNEEYYKEGRDSRARRRVLEDLYTVLARAYLHAGHIDDAMLVIIRAKKSMAVERLGGLAELDAKTAHLVRAGLAAGRLLDGGGLATMFVKSNQSEQKPQKPRDRQGASRADVPPPPVVKKRPATPTATTSGGDGAKIIPFPSKQ
jgi:hypothetical protein